jgi:type IV pilus assembly protein PilF
MRLTRVVTRLVLLGLMLPGLTGCITETDRPERKVDPVQLVQKQIELAIGYVVRADYQRAKENLRKALEQDPRSGLAHSYMGYVFQREGETDLAEEHFQKAVRFEPTLSAARNNYASFLFSEQRYLEAIEHLKVAADDRYYNRRADVFENLGRAYMRVNDPDNAESSFVRSIELNPRQPRSLLALADLRHDQQRYPESWSLYNRFTEVSQQTARSLWLCVQLAERFSNQDDKASCALSLKNIFPATEEYRQYRARYE